MAADGRTQPPSPPPRRYKVGYALSPGKQGSFIKPSLVAAAGARGIDLVPIDPALPLSSQGPFDLVVQKLIGDQWNSNLENFAKTHPSVPIVDRPADITRIHNRISMLQVVSELDASVLIGSNDIIFGIPSQVVVYSLEDLSNSPAVSALRFPLIAKPLVADGSDKSHKMSLVFNRQALIKLGPPPLVLQEFVNHGGVIFKVYVVDSYVTCMKRRSLPDVSHDSAAPDGGCMSFSQISNLQTAQEGIHDPMIEGEELPPSAFLNALARGLRHALRLRLFNFDMIRDAQSRNRYYIIDINYFPGYAKMPAYESVLTDFFWNMVHKPEKEEEVSTTTATTDAAATGKHGG